MKRNWLFVLFTMIFVAFTVLDVGLIGCCDEAEAREDGNHAKQICFCCIHFLLEPSGEKPSFYVVCDESPVLVSPNVLPILQDIDHPPRLS